VLPADCRLLAAYGLEVDESSLTGESLPVAKTASPVFAQPVAERACMAYEGTNVVTGHGSAVVVATGTATELGRSLLAAQQAAPPTGVERRLAQITRTTLPIALASAASIVAAGLVRGRPARDTLGAGVGLAVASVPEGLPFLVNAAQLAAARRLSTRGALVRNPRALETLGRVDVLCFDKTGTLTEGSVALAAVSDGTSESTLDDLSAGNRQVLAAALRATPQPRTGRPLAHQTDAAVVEAARGRRLRRNHKLAGWRRAAALPFEPSRGYHATLATTGRSGGAAPGALLSVKGAPETVLARCRRWRRAGEDVELDGDARAELAAEMRRLAGQGRRVLAVAEAPAAPARDLDDRDVDGLTFLGFLAFADRTRPTAPRAVRDLRAAGVQIIMVTGDHPATAGTIAGQLDLLGNGDHPGKVVTGPELDELDDERLDELLPQVAVVARGTPLHKVRVVKALQRRGRTVAMTGDGANDAAAIRLADVGIAVGEHSTPSARSAADMVVTDSRLETILAGLVEGRAIWGAIQDALSILVGGNLGEIAFTTLGAAVTGRSPLSARQLLLVNLLTDLAPALTLAVRAPAEDTTAELLTRGPDTALGADLTRAVTLRATSTAAGASTAWLLARLTGRRRRADTVGLLALVGTQLGQTLLSGGRSPWVLASTLGSVAVLATIVQTPGLSQFFGCTPVGPIGWSIATGSALTATGLAAAIDNLTAEH
jgi:magnesium-transporting ATPase (P-type)